MILQLIIHLNIIASIYTRSHCNKIKIGNNYYDKIVLWEKKGKPINIIVHKSTNTLYFAYTTQASFDAGFQLGYIHMDGKDEGTIAGITGGCAIAIDQENDDIYLGGTMGIYKYNLATKMAEPYRAEENNIWSLFYRRNLFYISYPTMKLYLEYNGNFSIVREFSNFEVENFFVTSNNVIYFANRTGFYVFNSDEKRPEVVSELIIVKQIVEDNDEIMYIASKVGVYAYNPITGFIRILEIPHLNGIAFDKYNNLIYSDENSITMLKYCEVPCKGRAG